MKQTDATLELERINRLGERLNKKEYKERNHGITRKSTKFLNDHISKIGVVVCVEGTKDDTGDYWTTFSDRDGNKIVVSGFAWGYYGEGPSGLQKILQLHWDYSSLDVANFGNSFKIT